MSSSTGSESTASYISVLRYFGTPWEHLESRVACFTPRESVLSNWWTANWVDPGVGKDAVAVREISTHVRNRRIILTSTVDTKCTLILILRKYVRKCEVTLFSIRTSGRLL
jgi:hypothetical protein